MAKILIIEDNPDVRENIAEILDLAGHDTLTAANGKIGIEQAVDGNPDLILCDVMMPELDGFGVLKIISKNPRTADIPFIFLTAKTEQSDFRKGMGLGADDYITKPFDDTELLEAIEIRLRKSDKIKKAFSRSQDGLNQFYDEAKAHHDLIKLSENREERNLNRKAKVFEEGQRANWLYFISKGKVKCYKTNEFGKELITHIYSEGDFFGYLPLITDATYEESASVIEDSTLVLIPKSDFNLLLFGNREFGIQFIKMLAKEVSETEENLINLAYNSVRQKVARALVILFHKYQHKDQARFSILREDLAALAATAKETVIRTISDFKDEGLITIEENDIVIKSVKALENLRY
ncbi:MAG: response regulator [Saprospiraceae bacterium]|nr:response regulator [Saprospiraceae bacterium]